LKALKMTARFLMSFLFIGLFMQAYSQVTVIGKWRRVNPNLNYKDTAYKKLKWGDLEIRSDSNFHIEGDSASQNSTIPGWHVGEEYNGTWELNGRNRLTLWMEPKENKMFLWFVIIKLTKEKLVLRLGFNRNDKRHDITYLRL
jgi:hypothetical protein